MAEFDKNNYNHPSEISEALYKLITVHGESETEPAALEELENAIYNLQAMAENPYNSEYWRTLYKALSGLVETESNIKFEMEHR